ncbi:phosphate signaling complex PhoU family protein [Geoglobus acetivorans]|uniref:Putative phosphate regulatory protein n=1 Tax=Geoglobus acetivorans TaxID=565033 RepID=A0A0A7GCW7_GEOAI|nr:putative phosphate regulatory protein [Geoglobus acetivorans]
MKRVARKIFVSGSSFIISLPKEWIRDNSLKAGDTIFCDIGKDSLTIRPRLDKANPRESRIDVEEDEKMLLRKIISHYLAGYETIRIPVNERTRRAVYNATALLIGAEILEDSGNEIWMEVFVDEKRFRVDDLLERMGNTVISMLKDFRKNLVEYDPTSIEVILQRENEVDRLYFLILRILKSALRYSDILEVLDLSPIEILGTRTAIKNIERVGDHLYGMTSNLRMCETNLMELEKPAEEAETAFRLSLTSLFKRDEAIARDVFAIADSFGVPRIKPAEMKDMVLVSGLMSGLERIVGYSEDIAEITLNLATP